MAVSAVIVQFGLFIYYGRNGDKIAWANRDYQTHQEFRRREQAWALAGVVVLGLGIAYSCGAISAA